MRAIITGATKGIGWAIAQAFAAEGYDIAICARTAADLDQRKAELLAQYPNMEVLSKVVDMRKKEAVLDFAEFITKTWTQIDVLINNAGVFIMGDLVDEEEGVLEKMIETNLYSAYYFTRALLPSFLQEGKGHIFNICSIASQIVLPQSSSYCISKFALLGFSKALRAELKDKGIKVTAILPGATWSNAWAGVSLPEDRLAQASDIALAVLSATKMSASAVVEEIVVRPQLGDL